MQLFAIAHGIGGHASGDVASRLIVESLHQFVADTQVDIDKTWPFGFHPDLSYQPNRLKTAIRVANIRIAHHLEGSATSRGMGATVAALRGTDRVNVRDCRAYFFEPARCGN